MAAAQKFRAGRVSAHTRHLRESKPKRVLNLQFRHRVTFPSSSSPGPCCDGLTNIVPQSKLVWCKGVFINTSTAWNALPAAHGMAANRRVNDSGFKEREARMKLCQICVRKKRNSKQNSELDALKEYDWINYKEHCLRYHVGSGLECNDTSAEWKREEWKISHLNQIQNVEGAVASDEGRLTFIPTSTTRGSVRRSCSIAFCANRKYEYKVTKNVNLEWNRTKITISIHGSASQTNQTAIH